MAKKPPAPQPRQAQVRISYAGLDQGWYVFRVHLGENGSLVGQRFETSLTQWLFVHAPGRWYMGNGFARSPDMPQITVENPGFADTFVLLRKITDVAAFEGQFGVTGWCPTALVPGHTRPIAA